MTLFRALIVTVMCGVLTLSACSQSVEQSSLRDDKASVSQSTAENPKPSSAALQEAAFPKLSEVRINVQGGNETWRPDAREAITGALFQPRRFVNAPNSDSCKADISVYYAITSNGKLVEFATFGTALVGSEAMIHCRKGQAFETFRVELKETKDFKDASQEDLAKLFGSLLGRVAEKAVEQLLGQVLVRPLTDDGIIRVLSDEKRVGKLMEAAIEAGERRLKKALPHLVSLTKHTSDVVRLRAAAALGLLKTDKPEVIRALAQLTEGAKNEQVVVAIAAMSDIGGPKALRYLSNIAVSHPDEIVRALARAGAEKIKRLTP